MSFRKKTFQETSLPLKLPRLPAGIFYYPLKITESRFVWRERLFGNHICKESLGVKKIIVVLIPECPAGVDKLLFFKELKAFQGKSFS